MTNVEFETIISRELDRLKTERDRLVKQYSFHQKVTSISNLTSREDERMNKLLYEISLVQEKIRRIQDFVGIEAKARIQLMSEIEVEEFRKAMIRDANQRLNKVEEKINKTKKKIQELNEEYEKLSVQDITDEKINRGKLILTGLQSESYNVQDLEKDKQTIEQQIRTLEQKTVQEIREDLLAKIKTKGNIDELIAEGKDNVDLSRNSADLKRIKKISELRVKYHKQIMKEHDYKYRYLYDFTKLPPEIATLIQTSEVALSFPKGLPNAPVTGYSHEELMDNIEFAIKVLGEDWAEYERIADKKLLSKMVGKTEGVENIKPEDANITLFEIFLDIMRRINENSYSASLELEINRLKELMAEKNELSKNAFRRMRNKDKLKELDNTIRISVANIYKIIASWYKIVLQNMKFELTIDFSSQEGLAKSLDQNDTKIDDIYCELSKISDIAADNLDIEAREIDEIHQETEALAEEISKLTGAKEEEHRSYTGDIQEETKKVAVDVARGYQSDILQKVRDEAQKRAFVREQEIKELYAKYGNKASVELQDVTQDVAGFGK